PHRPREQLRGQVALRRRRLPVVVHHAHRVLRLGEVLLGGPVRITDPDRLVTAHLRWAAADQPARRPFVDRARLVKRLVTSHGLVEDRRLVAGTLELEEVREGGEVDRAVPYRSRDLAAWDPGQYRPEERHSVDVDGGSSDV